MFDYEPRDEIRSLAAEEKFKSDFFDTLADEAISSMTTLFEQIRKMFRFSGMNSLGPNFLSIYCIFS